MTYTVATQGTDAEGRTLHAIMTAPAAPEDTARLVSPGWTDEEAARGLAALLTHTGGACYDCAHPATHYYLHVDGRRYPLCERHVYDTRRWEPDARIAAL